MWAALPVMGGTVSAVHGLGDRPAVLITPGCAAGWGHSGREPEEKEPPNRRGDLEGPTAWPLQSLRLASTLSIAVWGSGLVLRSRPFAGLEGPVALGTEHECRVLNVLSGSPLSE